MSRRVSTTASWIGSVLVLLLVSAGGCGRDGTGPGEGAHGPEWGGGQLPAPTGSDADVDGTTTTSTTPGTTTEGEACEPEAIVGATWTPGPVTCPFGPDAVALASCSGAGSVEAVYNGETYPSVQGAIDASPVGATVYVCPGTYTDLWSFAGRTLVAADPTPGATVVTHVEGEWVTSYMVADDAVVKGFSVDGMRGFRAATDTDLVGECLWGRGSRTILTHGEPYDVVDPGTVTMTHSTCDGCFGPVAGGVVAVVEDSAFLDGVGSTPAVTGNDLTVRRTAFMRGTGEGEASPGRGVRAIDATVEDCWFEGNYAKYTGGVAILADRATVRGSTFLDNEVETGLGDGGLIQARSVDIADSTFVGNHVRGSDGLMSLYGASKATRSRFEGNTADRGGVVFQVNLGTLEADHIIVSSNVSIEPRMEATVSLSRGVTFSCTCCDFGAGASNNEPNDLRLSGSPGVVVRDLPLHFSYTVP